MATLPVPPPWSGVVGIDGEVPIYDPAARWCWWSLNEVYMGGAALAKYVPKVGDYVEDVDLGITYQVYSLDLTTLIPELRVKDRADVVIDGDDDLILSIYGSDISTLRLYYDSRSVPRKLTVDKRLKVGGTTVTSAKIFRGTDVSPTGIVISMIVDGNGQFLTTSIPMELLAFDSHDNHAIKNVKECYTRESLTNGEICTLVCYDSAGHVVTMRRLLVVDSTFIADSGAGTKYISSISLDSPFLSQVGDHLLEYPMNIPLQAMNLTGLIHYSDGTTQRHPVDGSKFSVYGLNTYVATHPGQSFPIVLKYTMSIGEQAVSNVSGVVDPTGKFITESYTLKTLPVNGAYAVKLYCSPVWVDAATGYRLEWFLYNLDRTVQFNVTPYVRINTNIQPFLPKGYGTAQNLSVSITLSDVSSVFSNFVYTQTLLLILNGPGTDRGNANWLIGYDPGQSPLYGVATHARVNTVSSSYYKVNLSQGLTNIDDWFDMVYKPTKPLKNPLTEAAAPLPTHYILKGQSGSVPIAPIANILNTVAIAASLTPVNGTLTIEFIHRTANNDLLVGVAGMQAWEDPTL